MLAVLLAACGDVGDGVEDSLAGGAAGSGAATEAGAAGFSGADGGDAEPAQTCVGAVGYVICRGVPDEHPDCDGRTGLLERYCEGDRYMSRFIPSDV